MYVEDIPVSVIVGSIHVIHRWYSILSIDWVYLNSWSPLDWVISSSKLCFD